MTPEVPEVRLPGGIGSDEALLPPTNDTNEGSDSSESEGWDPSPRELEAALSVHSMRSHF